VPSTQSLSNRSLASDSTAAILRSNVADLEQQHCPAAKYPLNVISPKSHAFLNSSYGNLPAQLHHAGEQVVIVNPKDALARNVGEGSAVRIFNDRGSFEAIAKVSADVMQGIVVAPLGYWRDSSRAKGTVNALSPGVYADLGRAPTFSDTLVEVAVAEVAAAAE
jgi:anaerobic selenocysteine-containing dehydrogenase